MKIKRLIGLPLGIAGASVGMGIIGGAVKGINSNIGENLEKAGENSSSFISPVVNISMGGLLINQLKKIKPKK